MPFLRPLLSFLLLLLLVPASVRAQSESTAAANKRLFDRTVDELNFRTMETVYDKSFTRRKFPVTLRTAKARKDFTDFNGRADLLKLFQNYNGVSERFKNRFGSGRTDLAEFEKQLNSLLVDRNFEFFIRVLPRDERVALVRALQRVIGQGAAQFNASQDPAPEDLATDGAPVPADVDAVASTPEETDYQPEASLTSTPVASPTPASTTVPSASHDWMDWLTLLLAGTSTLLLLRLFTSTLPDLRARLNDLQQQAPNTAPAPRSGLLPEDRYEDEEEIS